MTSIQKLPIAVDATISRRVREVRTASGLSLMALADKLGISYQQVQKYEKGASRIAASRLHQIATVCGVPIESMFVPSRKTKKPASG